MIVESIIQNHPEGFLDSKVTELINRPPSSDWDATRKSVCIEALEYFASLADEADFSTYECKRGSNEQPKVDVNGINISVRPEILLYDETNNVVGAIKLIFSKNRNAEEDEIKYIGTLLHHYIKQTYNDTCSYKNCYVIDIFAGTVTHAPQAYQRRMNDIQAACSELYDTWQRIE